MGHQEVLNPWPELPLAARLALKQYAKRVELGSVSGSSVTRLSAEKRWVLCAIQSGTRSVNRRPVSLGFADFRKAYETAFCRPVWGRTTGLEYITSFHAFGILPIDSFSGIILTQRVYWTNCKPREVFWPIGGEGQLCGLSYALQGLHHLESGVHGFR